MTFNMIRLGLPNTAAIAALAIMPVVALTTFTDSRPATAQIEPVAICQTSDACTQIAAVTPEFAVE